MKKGIAAVFLCGIMICSVSCSKPAENDQSSVVNTTAPNSATVTTTTTTITAATSSTTEVKNGGWDITKMSPGKSAQELANHQVSVKMDSVRTDTDVVLLNMSITNDGNDRVTFGETPWLEVQQDGKWYVIPMKEHVRIKALGHSVMSQTIGRYATNLNEYYHPLPSGHYRFLIDFYPVGYAGAEFDLP